MSIRVSALHFYPVKSCAGTTVSSAQLTKRGIAFDREWMVVDGDGMFVTQRELPRMCLIKPTVNGDANDTVLELEAPGMSHMKINGAEQGKQLDVTVWRDTCRAVDQGDAVAEWLSEFLRRKLRLVRMEPNFVRQVDQQYAKRESDRTGFADGFPLLLTSEESLADLNSRMPHSLPMDRFRPNLVVTGCGAFEEDTWRTIRAGNVTFDVVKPCARCVITTVEQTTANTGAEPLKTLASFRQINNKLMFGQNIVHHEPGKLTVGDPIEILD